MHTIRKDVRAAIFDDSGNMSSLAEQSSPTRRARTTKRFKIVNRGASTATEKLYTWLVSITHFECFEAYLVGWHLPWYIARIHRQSADERYC